MTATCLHDVCGVGIVSEVVDARREVSDEFSGAASDVEQTGSFGDPQSFHEAASRLPLAEQALQAVVHGGKLQEPVKANALPHPSIIPES